MAIGRYFENIPLKNIPNPNVRSKSQDSTGCHPSFIFRYVLTLRVNIASQHVAKRLDLYLRVDIAS